MQEIELKYKLPNEKTGTRILEDVFVQGMMIPESEEDLQMESNYYDTKERIFCQKQIAFRVRKENHEYVATIKWNSKSRDGLFIRNECNVEVNSKEPDLTVFKTHIDDPQILELLNETQLEPVLSTRFLRRKIALDYEGTVVELAVDIGEIRANSKTAPISELEAELISGSTETLLSLDALLKERFGLVPENKSKLKRGFELLEK